MENLIAAVTIIPEATSPRPDMVYTHFYKSSDVRALDEVKAIVDGLMPFANCDGFIEIRYQHLLA